MIMAGIAKGTLYLMASQAAFLISGYAIHLSVGRELGPAAYGVFGLVIGLMTAVNVLVTTGIPTAVSKYVAEDERRFNSIIGKALKIQFVFSIALSVAYGLAAGTIASLLGDPSLTPYIVFTAVAMPFYAEFNTLLYAFNGLKQFGRQAIASVFSSAVKVATTVALIWLGFGIIGGIAGYILAAVAGLVFAWLQLKKSKSKLGFAYKKLVAFSIPVVAFSFLIMLLQSLDLFFVKALLKSDVQTGWYAAAGMISKLPFYLLTALAMTILPAVSENTSKMSGKAKAHVKSSFKYLLLMLIPATVLLAATSQNALTLLYSHEFANASGALTLLAFGTAFLTIFSVLCAVINGMGKPRTAMALALASVIVASASSYAFIPAYGLQGAALAITLACMLSSIAAGIIVWKKTGPFLDFASIGKISAASLAMGFAAHQTASYAAGLLLIPHYALMGALYLAILLAFGEIGFGELNGALVAVKKVFLKK